MFEVIQFWLREQILPATFDFTKQLKSSSSSGHQATSSLGGEDPRWGTKPTSHTKNIDSFGAPPFNLFAPFHLNDALVCRSERGRCNSAKEKWEEEDTGTEEGLETPPQGARQPSSGWALWYILPIFHAHPSWCDPTQGLLCPWQPCAGKHAAALIAWNREQRPPRRGEGGHWGTLCFGPAWLWTQTDVRTALALSAPRKEEALSERWLWKALFWASSKTKTKATPSESHGNMAVADKSHKGEWEKGPWILNVALNGPS